MTPVTARPVAKLTKVQLEYQNAAAAHKLAQFRSGAASASKAGARKGFGITERSPHSRGLQSRSK